MEKRWNANESYTYKISLQGDVSLESNQVVYDEQTFVKDYATVVDEYDRVKPFMAEGQFATTLTISDDGKTVTYHTEQTVTDYYLADNSLALTFFNEIDGTEQENAYFFVEQQNDYICFTSTTIGEVTFNNDSAMQPISSVQEIYGYYLGATPHKEVNNVKFETTYEEGKATVVRTDAVNGNKEYTYELEGNVVDALQIPLVARSLDQSHTTTDGKYVAPSVSVYDFKSNQVVALTLNVTAKTGVLLDALSKPGENYPYATASVVSVGTQNSTGFLYTFTSINGENDTFSTSAGIIHKYTQVRFQSEYYVYELTDLTEGQVEDLKYVVTPETAE